MNQNVEIYCENTQVITLRQFVERYKINLLLNEDKTTGGDTTRNKNIIDLFGLNIDNIQEKNKQYQNFDPLTDEFKKSTKNIKLINKYNILNEFASGGDVNSLLDLYIFPPVKMYVPYHMIPLNVVQTQGNFQIKNIKLNNLLKNELKRLKERVNLTLSPMQGDSTTRKKVQKLTVFLWSKSYTDNPNGNLLNLTPFITNGLSIDSNMSGANFRFSLPPITAHFVEELGKSGWRMKNYTFDKQSGQYISRNSVASTTGSESFDYQGTNNNHLVDPKVTIKSKGDKRERFNYNENYFFDKIIGNNDIVFISFDEYEVSTNDIEIPISELSNRKFDLIGLIDDSSVSESYMRDSVKVTIDIAGRDLMKLFIDDNTNFYANAYSNPDSSNIFFNFQDIVNERSFLRNDATGYILELADQTEYSVSYLLNFLVSRLSNIQVCPDVVFNFLKEKSYFFKVRRQFNETTREVEDKGLVKVQSAGIWQCVKMIVDDYSSERKVYDPNLIAYQGSLLNYVNKVCQRPFVEFFGDTYNDNFLLIVRKPPFDKESYNNLPFVEIYPHEVRGQKLEMDDSKAYSWYNLKRNQSLYTQNVQTNFLTAVFFPEIAEIWGSKPLEITMQYIDDLYDFDKNGKRTTYDTLLKDFRYMIESNAYLPFTRKGQITIVGNSNVKKGMAIKLMGTGEQFYVEAVSHRFSTGTNLDYTTVITVSRGMKESFMTPETNKYKISYFDLVEFSKDFDKIGTVVDSNKSVKINQTALKFFLQNKQFI